MNNPPTVSLVIVDFFKAQRVIDNVNSALEQKGDFIIEIIIIDNSCDSNNAEILLSTFGEHQNVNVIINDSNTGYVEATNQGVALTTGEYIFVVNPDIVWLNNSIIGDSISVFMNDSSIGILGTKQLNDDGSTPETVRCFPNILAQVARRTYLRRLPIIKKIVADYEISNFSYERDSYVDWIQSSFMVVKRNVWNEICGLDPRFFIFMADPDICYKSWDAGYKVKYVASIEVGADGKRCSAGGFKTFLTNRVLRYHFIDAVAYECKYLFNRTPKSEIYRVTVK